MLTTLILLPMFGAIIVGCLPANFTPPKVKTVAIAISGVILGLTFLLLSQFDLNSVQMQFTSTLPWLPQLGLTFSLGLDGVSLPLIVLSSTLTILVMAGSDKSIDRPRLYYAMILLVNAGIAGAFLAQNLLLFVLFYELELIPLYLLIGIWGGAKRNYAAMKFLIYTAVSGILILAAFLGMAWLSQAGTFDYGAIATENFTLNTQLILLTILLLGFGIKIPLVPLHTWLPDAYVEASPPVAILLGGILAKLGTYGLIRFGVQLFPEAWSVVAPGLAIIGAFSVLYGALTAIAQKDIKRMVAYSSIGHMGYILVAAAAGTELSLIGAIAQMVAHGFVLAILFYLVGIIEAKAGTRDLDVLNGLMNPIRGLPLTSGLLILGGMASAGIPGLIGFIAEFLVFQGSFAVFPIPTLLCVLASGLTAVYFVILINRTCFGKLDNKIAYFPRVTLAEQAPALVLAAIIFFLGVQPTWLVRWIEPTGSAIVSSIKPTSNQSVAANLSTPKLP